MSFIDSSTASPLAALSAPPGGVAEEGGPELEEVAVEEETPAPRKTGLVQNLLNQIDDINLARYIDQQTLDQMGATCVEEYELDVISRAEWLSKAEAAMKFATQKAEVKQYPWPGASNVIFPLIGQAAITFGSRTYPSVVQGANVVKGKVWGSDRGTPVTENGKSGGQPEMEAGPDGQPMPVWLIAPGEKRQRADRIGEYMSQQLLVEMPEWEPQTDQLLHQIPIIGGAIRKTYRDPSEDRNYSLFVSLVNLVWDYGAASFEVAPRHTEKLQLYPHEIIERERTGRESEDDGGMFLAIGYAAAETSEDDVKRPDGEVVHHSSADPDAPQLFIEQHRRWDLDDDGYPEPYVITVHKASGKVVRIVARYDEDTIHATKNGRLIQRIDPVDYYTLIPFLPSIDGGSYPMGFGHLLQPLNEAINSTLNQMFDAGHLKNAGGGFISSNLAIPSGQVQFEVGKYTRVTTRGQAIRDSVFPLPFPGPDTTLFQLLGTLITAGKEIAGIQDILSGDAAIANAPPTTVLALIEQGLKVYTAIYKRVFRALGSEFDKLYRLNRRALKAPKKYTFGDEEREIHPDDFRLGGGVEPIADPAMVTDMQKLIRAQIIAGYLGNPLMRQDEIIRRNLEAANVERIDDLFAPPDPTAAIVAQTAMAMAQAELGRVRAQEQKDATQAFYNLARARAIATGPEEKAIQAQMDFLRLHIESLNTSIRAAAIDHKFHDTKMRGVADEAIRASKTDVAPVQTTPTPGPTGEFPVAPGPEFTGGAATPTPSPELV